MKDIKQILEERIVELERELEGTDANNILSQQLIKADLHKFERELEFVEHEIVLSR